MVSVKKSKFFSSLFFSKITLRTESPSILSRKDRSDSAGRVIQNRSIVGKYNLIKRNSLRTILFLNETKNNRMGILMVTADTLYVHPIRHSNLETRRQLEPKWIPQLLLGSLGTVNAQICY